MREIFTYGSVGGALGNQCFYPERGNRASLFSGHHPCLLIVVTSFVVSLWFRSVPVIATLSIEKLKVGNTRPRTKQTPALAPVTSPEIRYRSPLGGKETTRLYAGKFRTSKKQSPRTVIACGHSGYSDIGPTMIELTLKIRISYKQLMAFIAFLLTLIR